MVAPIKHQAFPVRVTPTIEFDPNEIPSCVAPGDRDIVGGRPIRADEADGVGRNQLQGCTSCPTSGSIRIFGFDTDGPHGSTSISAETMSPAVNSFPLTLALEPA